MGADSKSLIYQDIFSSLWHAPAVGSKPDQETAVLTPLPPFR
jgi:hypothetical protein